MLSNQFEALSVEELRDFEGSKTAARRAVEYEIDEEDDYPEDEKSLSPWVAEVFCLFEGLNNIRQFLAQTWTECLNGNIDLINASIVTDTGIQLTKQLIQELVTNRLQTSDEFILQKIVYGLVGFADH